VRETIWVKGLFACSDCVHFDVWVTTRGIKRSLWEWLAKERREELVCEEKRNPEAKECFSLCSLTLLFQCVFSQRNYTC
jgi:hypothetical protein